MLGREGALRVLILRAPRLVPLVCPFSCLPWPASLPLKGGERPAQQYAEPHLPTSSLSLTLVLALGAAFLPLQCFFSLHFCAPTANRHLLQRRHACRRPVTFGLVELAARSCTPHRLQDCSVQLALVHRSSLACFLVGPKHTMTSQRGSGSSGRIPSLSSRV